MQLRDSFLKGSPFINITTYVLLHMKSNIMGGDYYQISDSDSGWSFVINFNLRLRNGDYQYPEIA